MHFISVDGGATKTIAVLYDDESNIKGVGVKGSSNFRNVGVDTASSNIRSAIESSLSSSGLTWEEIDFFTFALAGVKDSAKSTQTIEQFVSQYDIEGRYELFNDGEAGFKCRFPDENGIIAAPGTGMIAYGKQDDNFDRSSGWGWFIGDEGGAFYIGRRAIQEVAKIADGRLNLPDSLLSKLMDFFSVDSPRKMVNEIYTDKIDIRRIASIATIVSSLAKENDVVSKKILEEAAREAARCVIALQERMAPQKSLPVSGYGGVFRSGEMYWKTFRDEILSVRKDVEFRQPLLGYHAVLGSMSIILSRHGRKIDSNGIGKLASKLDDAVMKLPASERSKYLMMD